MTVDRVDLLVIGGGVNGCAHRPRRGRARALGAAGRAGGPGAGDLLGLDQAVPRRPALPRVLRVPAGARVADRARDAAPRDAAHLLAAALRAAAPCRAAAGLDAAARAASSTTTSAAGRSCRRRGRSTCGADPAGEPLRPEYRRGFEYSDCWVDDARLVVLLARDAAARGATIRTRTRFERAAREGDGWRAELVGAGRSRRGRWRRGRSSTPRGPWVGEVVQRRLRGADAGGRCGWCAAATS